MSNISRSASSGSLRRASRWPSHLAAWLLAGTSAFAAQPDPAKVAGPEQCAECHKSEVEAWKTTHHHLSVNTMHSGPKAKEIAEKLGIRRLKNEAICLNCHYTSKVEDDRPKVIAGTSCESCHGAALGWVKVHNDFGGAGAKKESEAPAHKIERFSKAEAAGMIRPQDTYAVAGNCFGCHTVPEEKLVNAGHPAGSDFELVAWSQGEVRHNFQADQKVNADRSAAHKRKLFVVGRMLDLEYSLRAAAKATQDGAFAAAMNKRVTTALQNLETVAKAASLPEVKAIIVQVNPAELKINNAPALTATADKVAALAKSFAKAHDGSQLSAVDSLLPGADKIKGKTFTF